MSGWIKLHRKIVEWEWYTDANTFRVFMHLLLNANIEPRRYRGVDIPAGSMVAGRQALAAQLGMSEQSVRTALDHLGRSEITIKSTSKFSVISIIKWSEYQSGQPADNQQSTNNQPTTNQQLTTPKECKNKESKNEEEVYRLEFEDFWKTYPNRQANGSKQKALSKYVKIRRSGVSVSDIAAGLERYRTFCRAGNYNQHASTWLNQHGWKEEWNVGLGTPLRDVPSKADQRALDMMEATARAAERAERRFAARSEEWLE